MVWPPISPKILAKELWMQPQKNTGVRVTESGSRSFLAIRNVNYLNYICMMHVRTWEIRGFKERG